MHAQVAAASDEPQLDVRALHLWRGEKHLLRGVSFNLRRGELLQVVGPNGVGKTSLLRCVAGLMPVESGEILWSAQPLERARDDFHQQLAYLAHSNALKLELTALENLRYAIGLRRSAATEELLRTLERLHICDVQGPSGARVVRGSEAARCDRAHPAHAGAPVDPR